MTHGSLTEWNRSSAFNPEQMAMVTALVSAAVKEASQTAAEKTREIVVHEEQKYLESIVEKVQATLTEKVDSIVADKLSSSSRIAVPRAARDSSRRRRSRPKNGLFVIRLLISVLLTAFGSGLVMGSSSLVLLCYRKI